MLQSLRYLKECCDLYMFFPNIKGLTSIASKLYIDIKFWKFSKIKEKQINMTNKNSNNNNNKNRQTFLHRVSEPNCLRKYRMALEKCFRVHVTN